MAEPEVWVVRFAKAEVNTSLQKAVTLGIAHNSAAPTQKDDGTVLVPLSEHPGSAFDSATVELVSYSLLRRASRPHGAPPPSPRERVEKLLVSSLHDAALLNSVPKKWERIGDIVILKAMPQELLSYRVAIAAAFCAGLHARAVCAEIGVVSGELREPRLVLLGPDGASTVTTHSEGDTRYRLDVTREMFASGNGTERMRFAGKIDARGETVVDMFAGIGYFTIPLARHGHPARIWAIEKNPNSHSYLTENVELNSVAEVVTPVLGDNRAAADHVIGAAHRVLMGYLPTPTSFLHRAFDFLHPAGGIIHYHYLCREEEKETFGLGDIRQQLALWPHAADRQWSLLLLGVYVVKSYAPHIWHCVADVDLKKGTENRKLS